MMVFLFMLMLLISISEKKVMVIVVSCCVQIGSSVLFFLFQLLLQN